jgi:mannosyltransferase OCH1-like enzyme
VGVKMTIPKIIHYCWFGKKPLPDIFLKCKKSWETHCPDFQLIFWNDYNVNISEDVYLLETYKSSEFAMMSDYFRLKIIYELGGVYLDIDVEILKSFNDLLEHEAFFSLDNDFNVNPGNGFGASKGNLLIKFLLDSYKLEKPLKYIPSPTKDTLTLKSIGYEPHNRIHVYRGAVIYPCEYFSPYDWLKQKDKIKVFLMRTFNSLMIFLSN